MKVLLVALLMVSSVFVSPTYGQLTDVISCVVKEKVNDTFVISCEDAKNVTTINFGIKESDVPDNWRKTVQYNHPAYYNVPLVDRVLAVGSPLKARMVNGEPLAVASCEVRIWRQVDNWRKDHPGYDRIPFALYSSPDEDCNKRVEGE